MPVARLAVGVKVAVLVVVLVTVRAPRVPLLKAISLLSNPTGALEKVKVMVAVWPMVSADTDDVMVTPGAKVSMVMAGEVPAPPALPARSV